MEPIERKIAEGGATVDRAWERESRGLAEEVYRAAATVLCTTRRAMRGGLGAALGPWGRLEEWRVVAAAGDLRRVGAMPS
jgi:hypothetical protein